MVGLSGGPDSTALLVALKEAGFEVVAAHFDHALRPGSERDAAVVARLCRELAVDLVVDRRAEPLRAGSVQAAAREARHAFLEGARRARGAGLLALGHTADDVVEGVLLHLLRGTALAGMRGMPRVRGRIVRPFLGTWRRDIEAFLEERGRVPLRDPANADLRYARARVRGQLLPRLERDLPGVSGRLLRVAERSRLLQSELEGEARRLIGGGRLALSGLRAATPTLRREALRQLFVAAGGSDPGLDRRTLASMEQLALRSGTGAGLDLPDGLRLRRLYGELEVSPTVGASPDRVTLVRWNCSGCDVATAAHLRPGARLSLGKRSAGLRMRPLPDRGSRKLQDILVDARVPRHERDGLDLVFADGQLAWVPGIALDARWAAPVGMLSDHVEVRGGPKGLC